MYYIYIYISFNTNESYCIQLLLKINASAKKQLVKMQRFFFYLPAIKLKI